MQLYSETIDKKSFWRSIRGPASHTTVAVASIASDLYIDVRYIHQCHHHILNHFM